MKKKLISCLLAVVMSLSCAPLAGAAVSRSADLNYPDVLSSLSSQERNALYEDLLGSVVISTYEDDLICSTLTASEIYNILLDIVRANRLDLSDWGGITADPLYYTAFQPEDFTRLTQQYFGYTIDYLSLEVSKLPTRDDPDLDTLPWLHYYNGKVYFHTFDVGFFHPDRFQPKNLYQLNNRLFYATFFRFYNPEDNTAVYYSAVVKKNDNGTWTLRRLYPADYVPTTAELEAYLHPSRWALDEVTAADSAGLIPSLNGDPSWQDPATRLQFCQLAVQLAETSLGRTLDAAPASTFTDCKDLTVRKAYAAGIVNGMTETTFSPGGTLTREQLATMLWRTASYIQTQNGRNVLTAGGSLSGFTDAGTVSSYAKDAVAALNKHGILKGTSNTALSPKGTCTVEQSVLLSYRTFLNLK